MKASAPIVGFGYFATRPYLWVGPLFATLLSLLVLIGAFTFTAYVCWPQGDLTWLVYSWGIFKSLGYASIVVLILWISLFPIALNLAFENMCKRILHEEKHKFKEEGLARATLSSIQVIFRTLGWRLFWPFLALIFLILVPPLTMMIVQFGMGHIALLDGCDLALSVQGMSGRERIALLKKHCGSLFLAGLLGGALSMALTVTFIGWLFWLPGMYAGAVLWTIKWKGGSKTDRAIEQ